MAASTSFIYSASQCSGAADYLRECTGSQLTTLAIYGESESSTCVYCGLLNTQGNVLVVAIVCNNGYYYPLGRACAFSTYRTGFTECSCRRMHLMYSNDHL